MAKTKTKTLSWDPAEHFRSEKDTAAYLEAALEVGDPEFATIVRVVEALGLKLHASAVK